MANTIEKKSTFVSNNLYTEINTEEVEKEDTTNDKIEAMNKQIEYMKKMYKAANPAKSAASNIASNFNPTLEMNKIACAGTPAQVRRYISNINVKINTLKKSGNYDSLIKRFRKIITKAEEKVTKLQHEEALEEKAKALERMKEIQESRKVTEVKNTKKRHRMLQEADDVRNAEAITYVGESGSGADVSTSDAIDVSVSGDINVSVSSDISVGSGVDILA